MDKLNKDRILTTADLDTLATLQTWVKEGLRVEWIVDTTTNYRTADGVLRHFVQDPHTAAFLTGRDDVRDAYVRISGMMEHFLPVGDVVSLIRRGYMVVQS
jgi:hypothetical protein